ncbi:hypothetical protein DRW48_11470 [Paracoccus suum]|uniref:Secreted protein n=1 Tax=Paracoccus suum TaxID=2259340 RepID=A0A344PLH7_9RHOB|nr:hypothetical protein DRW48_11470 [Paracoccus suum]
MARAALVRASIPTTSVATNAIAPSWAFAMACLMMPADMAATGTRARSTIKAFVSVTEWSPIKERAVRIMAPETPSGHN